MAWIVVGIRAPREGCGYQGAFNGNHGDSRQVAEQKRQDANRGKLTDEHEAGEPNHAYRINGSMPSSIASTRPRVPSPVAIEPTSQAATR